MGAGGVTVAGGMDEAAYRRLQMEERKFMAEAEERQMQLMSKMEDERVQRQQAEVNRQEKLRQNEMDALERMEDKLSDNVESVRTSMDDEDKDLTIDFYNSLAKGSGAGSRPE